MVASQNDGPIFSSKRQRKLKSWEVIGQIGGITHRLKAQLSIETRSSIKRPATNIVARINSLTMKLRL
jgi:hypothetical protein